MASTVYSMLRGIVFVIPAFILLPYVFGDNGLWLAVPSAELITMVIIIAVYLNGKRRLARS